MNSTDQEAQQFIILELQLASSLMGPSTVLCILFSVSSKSLSAKTEVYMHVKTG
jgi:hypothetical protein